MKIFKSLIRSLKKTLVGLADTLAPSFYRRVLLRRHPGIRIVEGRGNDVRSIRAETDKLVRIAVERSGIELLNEFDDAFSSTFLLGVDGEKYLDVLLKELLRLELRIRLYFRGESDRIIVKNQRHLEKLIRRHGRSRLYAIRAGIVWFSSRRNQVIGWHNSATLSFYQCKDRSVGTFVARSGSGVPPIIQRDYKSPGGVSFDVLNGARSLDQINFPIDVVYTWVDDKDPDWRKRKAERAGEIPGRAKHVDSETRYKNRDELKYSLRSLYYYAPWIRNIYIVTDDQVPDWFKPPVNKSIRFVSHSELFPDKSVLPTFNSHAIESVLHRIPGLSDNFLYMNDDVFFSSRLSPEVFFESNGIARTFLSTAMIPFCEPRYSLIASEWGAYNANEMLVAEGGRAMPYKTKHTPIPLKRDLLERLEAKYPQKFSSLRKRPFRTRDDIAPTSTLHTYFGLAEGQVVRGEIRYIYVNISRPDVESVLAEIEKLRHPAVYCLNDTEVHDPDFDWDHQEEVVCGFLQRMYPYRAPWEKA